MKMKQESFQAYLEDFLLHMDDVLSKAGMPVSERPMEAAKLFVDYLVIEIKGDTKENYQTRPWFASIFRPVQNWYKKRYGEALVHPKHVLTGAVKYHGALYLLRVPMTVAKPQGDGTCWLTFPKDVLPGEDPVSWIVNGPPLEQMRPKQLAALQKAASTTATRLRGIANDLLTIDLSDDSARPMVKSVLRHLDKAASDMCALNSEAASLAIWDLHMACEKAMKAYLIHEGVSFPMIHDLRVLNKLSPTKHDWSAVKSALATFPSEGRVMKWRYQEIAAPTLNDLWRFYEVAMQVCAIYAARMDRTYVFNNFSVHLRRPPWLGQD